MSNNNVVTAATNAPSGPEEFHSTRNALSERQQQPEEEGESSEEEIKIYKSTRLKGYFTLCLASSLNYVAAYQSNDVILANAVPATASQRRYAQAASMTSILLSFFAVLVHLDRWTPMQSVWIKAFQPAALFELLFVLVFVIWWFVATWVQTSIEGIAGDGKGQYNLYFSTWACFLTSVWTLDRWLVAKGMSSFKEFLASWPNRAPGWIAIFLFSFACFLSVLDLFLNWEDASEQSVEALVIRDLFEGVRSSQWNWLLTSSALTLPFAASFVLVELFRKNDGGDQHGKSELEIIVEGVVLGTLVVFWSASVIVATTPGGACSQVGNPYFFTWLSTIFVIETSVWWIHDWRKSIHQKIQEQEDEYKRIQEEVLSKAQGDKDDGKNSSPLPNNTPAPLSEEVDKHVKFASSREEKDIAVDIASDEEDTDSLEEEDDYEGVIPDVIGT